MVWVRSVGGGGDAFRIWLFGGSLLVSLVVVACARGVWLSGAVGLLV